MPAAIKNRLVDVVSCFAAITKVVKVLLLSERHLDSSERGEGEFKKLGFCKQNGATFGNRASARRWQRIVRNDIIKKIIFVERSTENNESVIIMISDAILELDCAY